MNRYAPSNIAPMATITGGLDGPQTATSAYVRSQVDVANDHTARSQKSRVKLKVKPRAEAGILISLAHLHVP